MDHICIYRLSDEGVVVFAARELKKYLSRITDKPIKISKCKCFDEKIGGLWVGTFSSFGRFSRKKQPSSEFDDEVFVDLKKSRGVIAGVNPRSVLLAVYRYLSELGFRWVRPGRDGEFTPAIKDPFRKNVLIKEKPSYRHRCVCIEGATGWQHVHDMLDWMPKVGFNSYFVQFRDAYQFWVNWYRHELKLVGKKERFAIADAQKLTERIWAECEKRGLIVQMMGHGWTCEPFGIRGLGWDKEKKPAPAKMKPYLAKVNGKREWFNNVIFFSQLCYSNATVRKKMVKYVGDYAQENPHVPVIYFVLGDGFNNHCECENCRKLIPSDWYAKLCNEVDAELTARNLPAKIVFDIYADCLWPPQTERFKNPDRFIMTFAPISRTYSEPILKGGEAKGTVPKFRLNETVLPGNVAENVAFLRGWQKIFDGDSFIFDYHLMWDVHKDLGNYQLAEVAHEDIRALRKLGLDGFVSCQIQRCFVPTSLIMTVMGRTLWDRNLSFEEITDDLYKVTFGRDWARAKRFSWKLSELCDPRLMRRELSGDQLKEAAAKFAKLPGEIKRFRKTITANMELENTCHRQSWKHLKDYTDICENMAGVLEAIARGEYKKADAARDEMFKNLCRKHRRIHRVFDMFRFRLTTDEAIGILSGRREPDF